MSDTTDHQQNQPSTQEEVKSTQKPSGGLSRRGARGGARGGGATRNDSGPVYRRKEASSSAAPDKQNAAEGGNKQPIADEETKEKKKFEPVGGRKQYQAKLEEKEKPVAPVKEEVKEEEPATQEEEEHEDEKPKRGRKQQVYRVKGAVDTTKEEEAGEGEEKELEELPEKPPRRSKSRPSKPQMVYRRKDEVVEESKVEEETKEGEVGEKKKKTRKGDQDQQEGAKKNGNNRRKKETEENQEAPKFSSAYEEFRAGYWRYPKREKIVITLETQIPDLPKKILEQPDETAYHKQQAEVDEKIEAINAKVKELGERFTERLQQLKAASRPHKDGGEEAGLALTPSASKELKTLFEQVKEKDSERKIIYQQMEVLNSEISDAENKKAKAEKKINPTYNKIDLIEKGMKELERKLQITTTTREQENKIIRDIEFIKNSRPFIEEFNRLKDIIFEKKHEKYLISQPLGELKPEIDNLRKRIEELKKSQDKAQENKEQIQKALDKINTERNNLRTQIQEMRQGKDKNREEFYKRLLAYEKQLIEIQQIEWMQGIKQRVIEREEQKRQWEEEKKKRQEERQKKIEEMQQREEQRKQREEERRKEQEEKQRKWEEAQLQRLDVHPYLYEIDMCDFLLKYCEKQDQLLNGRLIEDRTLSETKSRVAAQKAALENERREREERIKKQIEEQVEKGKIMRADSQKESLFKVQPQYTQKKVEQPSKLPVVQNQAQEVVKDESLNLDMAVIQKFGRLNITAPIVADDLVKAIKDLKEMKLAFLLVGDEEKDVIKQKFIKDCRRERGLPEPAVPRKLSGQEEEELKEEELSTGPTEEMRKLVKKIAEIKRKEKVTQQAQQIRRGGRRRNEDEEDIEEFGEDGLDIDTYEARYANKPKPEFDEENEGDNGDYRRGGGNSRGGRGGQRGGNRGGNNRGRGGNGENRRDDRRNQGGYEERGTRSKSRNPRQPRDYEEDHTIENEQGKTHAGASTGGAQRVNKNKEFHQVFNKEEEWPQI